MTNASSKQLPLSPVQAIAVACLTAQDNARIAAAIEAELAASTLVTYASAWRTWEAWCRSRGIGSRPAAPEAVAAFLTERAESGLSYGTIDMACSAITYYHHRAGLPDPMADLMLRRVRRGLRRIVGVAPRRQAHPLTVEEITQIVAALDPCSPSGVRDRAILLLGYASALRPGELAGLRLTDVTARRDGLLINIRRSKTDQDGAGQIVGVAAGQTPLTDPVHALAEWLKIRPRGATSLFTRIHKYGDPMEDPFGPRAVSRMVQARAVEAGLGDLPIGGHSLRAGHATTAAANGAPVDRIAAQTRHRDLDILIQHYIRPTDALATTTSRYLGL